MELIREPREMTRNWNPYLSATAMLPGVANARNALACPFASFRGSLRLDSLAP
jgi:hypothetical protein